MWSLHRHAWTAIEDLEAGELLQGEAGPVAVVSVSLLDTRASVYNLEIHCEHVYQIGVDGVVVHNACGRSKSGKFTEPQLPNKTIIKKNGVTVEHYYRSIDHAPAHLHVIGQGRSTRIGANGRPLSNNPPLTPAQQVVVNDNISLVRSSVNKIKNWLKFQDHLSGEEE